MNDHNTDKGHRAITGTAMLVWSAGLDAPQRVATLFLTAQACAAMDMPVEMYFSADSVRLLLRHEQTTVVGYGAAPLPLARYLQDTAAAGVRLLACSQALHHMGLTRDDLATECHGLGGVVQFAARCADPEWRTLVF